MVAFYLLERTRVMNYLLAAAMAFVVGCGPTGPTSPASCAKAGGDWVCSDNPANEHCWCDE